MLRHGRRSFVFIAFLAAALGGPAAASAARADLVVSVPTGIPATLQTITGFRVADKVRNTGRAKAPKTFVTYFLSKDKRRGASDPRFEKKRSIPSRRPGTRSIGGVRIVVPEETRSGRYWVLACVDVEKKIRESREGNNCAVSAKQIRVVGPNPLTVGFTRQSDRTETFSVSFEGNVTGSTVAYDGTVFQLDIPSGETSAETIQMTPLSPTFSPAPRNVVPQAAVLIEPADALLGATGGTLTIIPPAPLPEGRLLGFGFAGDGSEFHLETAKRDAFGGVVLQIGELGAYGYGTLPAGVSARQNARSLAVAAADLNIPAADRNRFKQKAAANPSDAAKAANDYYNEVIRPRLLLAAKSGTRGSVTALVQETMSLMRQLAILEGAKPAWETEAYNLFRQALSRLFNESYQACTAGGGDPFEELAFMLSIARQAALLFELGPTYSEALDWWFGPGAIDKIVACSNVKFQASFTLDHKYFTGGSFSSTGTMSVSNVQFALGRPIDPVTAPLGGGLSASSDGECIVEDASNPASGEFRVRSSTIVGKEHWVGKFVGGRYKPDAELKTEMMIRVHFDATVSFVVRINCDPGPVDHSSLWDLGGSIGSVVMLPTAGGTKTVTAGVQPFDPNDPEQTFETATISVSAAPS